MVFVMKPRFSVSFYCLLLFEGTQNIHWALYLGLTLRGAWGTICAARNSNWHRPHTKPVSNPLYYLSLALNELYSKKKTSALKLNDKNDILHPM